MSASSQTLVGVPVAIPGEWIDATIHRFVIPAEEASAGLEVRMVHPRPSAHRVQANLLITRVRADLDQTPREFLRTAVEDPSIGNDGRVLGHGECEHHEQTAAWLDLRFIDVQSRLPIFQRHWAMRNPSGTMVLMTLTSGQKNLSHLSKRLGFRV